MSKLVRANITDAELKALRLAAIRADRKQGDYNAAVLRAGMAALRKGEA